MPETHARGINGTDVSTLNKDGSAAVPSLRTLGTSATQAAAGDAPAAAITAHVAATDPHGDRAFATAADATVASTAAAALAAHVVAADPHGDRAFATAADVTVAANAADATNLTSGTAPAARLPVMLGDFGAGGTKGAVPAPAIGDATKFLRGDASWQSVAGGSTPTGTGFRHVTAGVEDGTSKLVADADVAAGAAIALSKLATIADSMILGNNTGGASVPVALTVAQVRTLLNSTNARRRTVTYVADGGGVVLTTGYKANVTIPFSGVITNWTVLGLNGATGAVKIDIFKSTYSGFPPASTICSTTPPEIAATNAKAQMSSLSGWSTTVTAGDVWAFKILSVTTFVWACVTVEIAVDE